MIMTFFKSILIVAVMLTSKQTLAKSKISTDSSAISKCQEFKKQLSKSATDASKVEKIVSFVWGQWMSESPTWATFVGYPGFDDKWPDLAMTSIQKRKALPECHAQLFETINFKKLNAKDQLTAELLKNKIKLQIKAQKFPSEYLIIDQLGGPHMDVVEVIESAPKGKLEDYENRLKRLESFPVYLEQNKVLLEEGLKKKITPVKFLVTKVPDQIQKLIFTSPKESPIYKEISNMPKDISETDRTRILNKTAELITNSINPALLDFKKFISETYIPQCRESVGILGLPNGQEWYQFSIESHTTLNKSAKEIHELGLSEVARINAEMETIRKQLKFKGSKKEFHDFLQTDKQFFFENPKDLIDSYQSIAKTIDPGLPKLFELLPRLPYGVKAMADYKAPSAPTAYYYPGSIKSGRAGYFEANTYNLKSRPKWEMEVLTAHEAVPGHHLQISIAQELGDLPEFRKHDSYTAFSEGWGLYSESLGEDLGLYKDPYSKYGQLSFEMWRAVRLVVDTGIHSLGWSKEKALNYFMENIPKNQLQSEVEVDRYINWPGQALAYKLGELKFKELKERAKKKLGDKFDIREFHKVVLSQGAIPLNVLESEFQKWLDKK